eukprot:8414600-Alexandrium_andersonii.AAC.1
MVLGSGLLAVGASQCSPTFRLSSVECRLPFGLRPKFQRTPMLTYNHTPAAGQRFGIHYKRPMPC